PTATTTTTAAPTSDSTSADTAAMGGGRREHRHPIALVGETSQLVIANSKGIAHVTGEGKLAKIGHVTVATTIDSNAQKPLLSTPWLLHADLTFTAARGEIRVRISPGTLGANPLSQPFHLQYTVL